MSLNRNTYKTRLCIDQLTKGWQEPNSVFLPGAMVPEAPIQYSWQLYTGTMHNKPQKHRLYFVKANNLGVWVGVGGKVSE